MTIKPAMLAAGLLLGSSLGRGEEHVFATPSDDRWHYPFNFTPGVRPLASCFSSVGNVTFPLFNDRDGMFIVAWRTAEEIEPGACPQTYGVESVTVTLSSIPGASWPIDRTVDEWYTFDANNDGAVNGDGVPRGTPGDRDGESHDLDAGRPLELFGVAFGENTDYATWQETSPYYGASDRSNDPRDPFPFVYQAETLAPLHVEDNVKGTQNEGLARPVFQFTPHPWSIGSPVGYQPGNQLVPFDVIFEIDLELSNGAVRRYVQEQLSGGRVFFAVTSLRETVIFGSDPGELPAFYTKEGTGLHPQARAPKLTVRVVRMASGDADGNCRSDLPDVMFFNGCFGGPDVDPIPPPSLDIESCRGSFDYDSDADVDLHDVARFVNEFAQEQD